MVAAPTLTPIWFGVPSACELRTDPLHSQGNLAVRREVQVVKHRMPLLDQGCKSDFLSNVESTCYLPDRASFDRSDFHHGDGGVCRGELAARERRAKARWDSFR
jgi:hypothetical protein